MRPDISRALAIDGWMSPDELTWLAIKAGDHENIAEIGSWMGRSTAALADNTDGVIYAIDTWMGSDEPAHQFLKEKDPDWLFGQFLATAATNVVAVRTTSLEAAARYAASGARFDMIFIDGAHDVESVKSDITAWLPLLAEGGLFCGHDYFTTVKEAVDELLEVKNGAGSIWVMR